MKILFKRQSWRMQSRSLRLSDLLEVVCTACARALAYKWRCTQKCIYLLILLIDAPLENTGAGNITVLFGAGKVSKYLKSNFDFGQH